MYCLKKKHRIKMAIDQIERAIGFAFPTLGTITNVHTGDMNVVKMY